MVNSAKASDLSLIEPVLKKYKNTAGSLITVLQEIQDIYGYLPEDALCHAAIELGIAPATVFGVATFYAQFRFKPVGRYFIMLCQGTACHVNGSEMIGKAVYEALGIRHWQNRVPDMSRIFPHLMPPKRMAAHLDAQTLLVMIRKDTQAA